MTLSKGWFTLVALVGACGIAVALLVPALVQREIDRQVSARLGAAAAAADAQLQLFSRRWIDSASHAALDVQLAEALDHASSGTANLELLHRTAQERLGGFQIEWKAYQAIAIDAHGRVLARAGAAADRWKDDLSAAQIVTEALKGFRLDDTWFDDGHLLKVVAAPVVTHDRYAGALLLALDLASDLPQAMADRVGADLALVVGGRVLGRSGGAPAIEPMLPELLRKAPELVRSGAHSAPLSLPSLTSAYLLVATAIPASLPAAQALLVVVAERPLLGTGAALKARLFSSVGQLPWLELVPVVLGLVLALIVGWLLINRENGAPIEGLHRSVQAVLRGDVAKIDEKAHPGRHSALARLINVSLERARVTGRTDVNPRSVQADISLPIAAEPPPPPPPRVAPLILPPLDQPESVPPVVSWRAQPEMTPLPLPAGPAAEPPRSRPLSPTAAGHPPLPPRPPPPPLPLSPLPPPLPGLRPPGETLGIGPFDRSLPINSPTGPHRITAFEQLTAEGFNDPRDIAPAKATDLQAFERGDIFPRAHPPRELEPAAAVLPDPLEVEFQAVFRDFVSTRQRCGESTEGLTYERFATKLRDNRDQLMARFHCKGARFQVYVKDGKAALKVTPVT